MSRVRLTKIFTFESAHALYGYDGKCKNIHGHSYKLWVTIIGNPLMERGNPKYGMVVDFGDLKNIVKTHIVDKFDHATILDKTSPHSSLGRLLIEKSQKIIFVDYQPTSENMLLDFSKTISAHLPSGIELHSLRLQETETSLAEWFASDNII